MRAVEEDDCGCGSAVWAAPSASGEGLSRDERLRDIAGYRIAGSTPSRSLSLTAHNADEMELRCEKVEQRLAARLLHQR